MSLHHSEATHLQLIERVPATRPRSCTNTTSGAARAGTPDRTPEMTTREPRVEP